MKIDQDRGWKTIAGFVILGVGGILFALAGTELAPVGEEIAIAIISAGGALAGIGTRDAKAKQIRAIHQSETTMKGWTKAVASLARAAGAARKPVAKPGKR